MGKLDGFADGSDAAVAVGCEERDRGSDRAIGVNVSQAQPIPKVTSEDLERRRANGHPPIFAAGRYAPSSLAIRMMTAAVLASNIECNSVRLNGISMTFTKRGVPATNW